VNEALQKVMRSSQTYISSKGEKIFSKRGEEQRNFENIYTPRTWVV